MRRNEPHRSHQPDQELVNAINDMWVAIKRGTGVGPARFFYTQVIDSRVDSVVAGKEVDPSQKAATAMYRAKRNKSGYAFASGPDVPQVETTSPPFPDFYP